MVPRRLSLGPQGDDRILLHGAPGRQRGRQRRDHDQHRRSGADRQGIARAHAVEQVGEERARDDARRDAGGDAQRHDRRAAAEDEPPTSAREAPSATRTAISRVRCPTANASAAYNPIVLSTSVSAPNVTSIVRPARTAAK